GSGAADAAWPGGAPSVLARSRVWHHHRMRDFERSSFALVLLAVIGAADASAAATAPKAVVRLNQGGYPSSEPRVAILMASRDQAGAAWRVIDTATGAAVFTASVGGGTGAWSSAFEKTYPLDFSAVTAPGRYRIDVSGRDPASSPEFRIDSSAALYAPLVANALLFFTAQRDGPDVDHTV